MSLPTHDEIRETISRSGCDLFAFFGGGTSVDPDPGDQCFIHSISHQDTELLALNIRRDDTPAVAGLITNLINRWESRPVKPGEHLLATGSSLMLTVTKPDDAHLDQIMDEALHSAVTYRGNKNFSVLMLFPVRRLTDEEVRQIETAHSTQG